MTMSSTKELFTPFKDPEREFRSYRKLLKTLSLDESRSSGFNLFFDLEEYSEEEVAKTMAKTMKQYMSKTRADYESGIARPKINEKDNFELKEMQVVILFYNGLEVLTRQILDSKGAIPSKNVVDAKVAIQKWLNTLKNGTMEHLGQEVLKLLTDWQRSRHNSIILEEKSRRSMKRYMLLK
ncbi:hypothetical protein Tco_0423933 [Tanacetum coccineum]